MSSSVKNILDFDGTLVRENSSRVLESVVLAQLGGFAGTASRWLYAPRTQRLIWPAFALLTRLFGGRDARLLVLLWTGRKLLRKDAANLFEQVATRLTLTPELSRYHRRPFIVLSTGLTPVIEAFLRQHPELSCQSLQASAVEITPDGPVAHLLTPASKTAMLFEHDEYEYLTDSKHEADLLLARLPWPHRLTSQNIDDGRIIYTLTRQD